MGEVGSRKSGSRKSEVRSPKSKKKQQKKLIFISNTYCIQLMTCLKKTLAIAALLGSNCSFAQTTLPVPVNLAATYTKGTRSPGGEPGKNYWQNACGLYHQNKFRTENTPAQRHCSN